MTTTEIERNARLAYSAVAGYRHSCKWCTDKGYCMDVYEELSGVEFPGFRNLGAGGSRIALLRDDFVYKVEYSLAFGWENHQKYFDEVANVRELTNYIMLMDVEIPAEYRFPVTDVVWIVDHPVLVAEFAGEYTGDWSYEYSEGHKAFVKATKLNDIYCDNVIRSGDYWYVVDFAQ